MPVDGALKVVPEPKSVLVPQEVPCQYQVSPEGGVPLRVIVTAPHCGELLIGSGGVIGAGPATVTKTFPQLEDQQLPLLLYALK